MQRHSIRPGVFYYGGGVYEGRRIDEALDKVSLDEQRGALLDRIFKREIGKRSFCVGVSGTCYPDSDLHCCSGLLCYPYDDVSRCVRRPPPDVPPPLPPRIPHPDPDDIPDDFRPDRYRYIPGK